MNFNNKIIWITGASSGIGEALAYEFAKVGAKLILSSRRKEELEKVKLNCALSEENIMILPLDLEKHDDYSIEVSEVIGKFGRIDILINNGGISSRAMVVDSSLEIDKRMMNINYFGTISLTKTVLPIMIKQQSGHLVVISSGMGKFGLPLRSAYAASKHALHGFFDTLRLEIWKDNISITIICPGFVKTNVSYNAITPSGKKLKKMNPEQENGMLPDVLAKKILKAIKKVKMEVYFGKQESLAIYIKRYWPSFLLRRLKKMKFN
ncbi:SDR family oxidoreductase [Bacteroidota bacterium]